MKRRQFLQSGIATLGFLGLDGLTRGALAGTSATPTSMAQNLTIGTRTLDINGRAAMVYSLTNGQGGPSLTLAPGDPFKVNLKNSLNEETLIHWHGLTPPFAQDGVPDNPLPMLKGNESRDYDFAVAKPGTFWMHAHTLQEQNLLAAPLIVHSYEDLAADRQEVVLLLHDFSFTPAEKLLADLTGGQAMNHGQHGMSGMDMGAMANDPHGMGMMAGMDVNDIGYDAYLANDRTLDDPQIVSVDKGTKVLLRIINGASSTAFTISTGGLVSEVRGVDGRRVQPISGTRFPLAMAQRIDLLVTIPEEGGAYPILALREGARERTGLILATKGAAIGKLAVTGDSAAPVLDLKFEASLRSLEPLAARPSDRAFNVQLTGNMMSYQWGMAGDDAIAATQGERVEITMMNMSMMSHPMHLHGHDFQVVAIDRRRFSGATRDTVLVPPMRSVTIGIDIVNPGRWPFHCHHLYHMVSGMMVHMNVS